MKIGFDNDKYLSMQSEHIRERIKKFDNKLYLEFGGKLFDDYHASRVLPGFQPDSKLQMLLQLKDQAEVVIVISAEDIISNKIRGDYGITYDLDVLRLIDAFQEVGLYVGSVCVTKYAAAPEVEAFEKRLNGLGIRTFRHYKIPGYPNDVARIVSDEGYGKNDYIETQRPLVVITAPGPGSGKMATCLSQLYHEYKRGVKAGYAKFETFPIWNIPLKHPVNLAYEAATADLTVGQREVEKQAHARSESTGGAPAAAIELPDGTVVTGKTGPLLGAAASALMNALKVLAGIPQETDLVSAASIEPIQTLKTNYLGGKNPRLHTDEILIALSSSAADNEQAAAAMHQLPNLKGCDVHSTVLLSGVDTSTLNRLGMYLTCDPVYEEEDRKYHKQ